MVIPEISALSPPGAPAASFFLTPSTNQAEWLTALPDLMKISEICLPGSHDAAAVKGYPSPYVNHNDPITQQLQSGVRLLDVRLKTNRRSDASFSFMTCHSANKVPLVDSSNEFQDFPSLMDECTQFLTTNPGEFIAMKLKIDDWSTGKGYETKAYSDLKALLNNYPIYVNHPGMPLLGAVRGKIVLFFQINIGDPDPQDPGLGFPLSWSENAPAYTMAPNVQRIFMFLCRTSSKG